MAEDKDDPRYAKRDQDAPLIRRALKQWKLSEAAEKRQRERELSDLQFEFDPWPQAAKDARSGYSQAGIQVPDRPMLSIPMLDQPIQLVINQEKGAHLGIQVHAEDEDANEDEAEFLQGKIRHIETKSRAQLARSWAFERAVRCGRGYYRIEKDWMRRVAQGAEAFDQELKVVRILNQFNVYDDPSAQEPGRCDRRFLFEVFDYTYQQYQERFTTSSMAAIMAAAAEDGVRLREFSGFTEMQSIGDVPEDWLRDDSIRVARWWEVQVERKAHRSPDGKVTRELETRTVICRTINAVEVIEEQEWDGYYIPYVLVCGREHNINGERFYEGLISRSKDSVRLVNYTASNAAETIAMQPRTPWVLAEGQEEGHEAEFVRATARPVPYVRYKPTTVNGDMVPPPQRNLQSPDLSADIALLQQAKDFVHAGTFTFDPSLGNLPQKDRSGKAIQALQQQSDAGNSHYLDNLAEISLADEAKILIDLIPHVYDRAGRVTDIQKENGERDRVMLKTPFFNDPQSGKPIPVPGHGVTPAGVKIRQYDLQPGANYQVVVSVGKSYQTRMQQGSDALGQLLQADPQLMPMIGWRYFWYNDNIPGHREIAEDLKKIRPPQLQEDQGPDNPEVLKAQLGQASQQLQMMSQQLEALTETVKSDQVKVQGQIEIKRLETEGRMAIAKLQSDTQIAVASIKAQTDAAASEAEARSAAMSLAHEQYESESQRQHEAAAGEMAHAQGLEVADRQHQQSIEQAAMSHQQVMEQQRIGHQQALEQGEAGNQQKLQQQAQAAALAPEPAESEE